MATPTKYSVVKNNVVINQIILDPDLVDDWSLAVGELLVPGGEIGLLWDGAQFTPPVKPPPTPEELATAKTKKIAEAWAEHEKRLELYIIQVPISGIPTPFGVDPISRENVIGINALIDKERGGLLPAGTIPNPRAFTPKGQAFPVQVSHQEFALIGAYMAAAKDNHFVSYATHKFVISSLTSIEDIEAYDITVGWPT